MTIGKNFAGAAVKTTISGSMTPTVPGAGGTFAVADASGYPSTDFVVTINSGNSTEEKIFCSARSGTTFTVGTSGRGYDGTAGADHSPGESCEHKVDAATITALVTHVDNTGADNHTQYTTNARAQALIDASIAAIPAYSTPAPYPRGVLYRSANLGSGQTFSVRATETDVTGMTAVAVTGDGVRRVRITARIGTFSPTNYHSVRMSLYEGASLIGIMDSRGMGAVYKATAAAGSIVVEQWVVQGSIDLIPSSAAHTYKISLSVNWDPALSTSLAFSPTSCPSYVIAEDIGNA